MHYVYNRVAISTTCFSAAVDCIKNCYLPGIKKFGRPAVKAGCQAYICSVDVYVIMVV